MNFDQCGLSKDFFVYLDEMKPMLKISSLMAFSEFCTLDGNN